MPFVEIPPEQMKHLSLFGYDLLHDGGRYAWYAGPHGRTKIDKTKPIVWVEDVSDAIQIGAIGVFPPTPDGYH